MRRRHYGPYILCNRLPAGAAVLDLERGGMKGIEKKLWQNDTSLGLKSWSYAPDEEYRSPNQVVDMLMDIRFTRSKDSKTLFATILGWPGEKAVIQSLSRGSISMTGLSSLTMFGCDKVLEWTQEEDGLHVKSPKETDQDSFAYVLELTFNNEIPSLSIFL